MTCIAWDGVTLAADKRVTLQGLARTVTKIFRVGDVLVGISGNGAEGMDMVEWVRGGCKPDDFPAMQRDKEAWAATAVFSDAGILLYECTPQPLRIEDKYFAMGSGSDYALAAMHCGRSAYDAVVVACHFDVNCGNGYDTLDLDQ